MTNIRHFTYDPMPTQARFHASPAPIRVLFGGCRAGKSTALAQEVGQTDANVLWLVWEESQIGQKVWQLLFKEKFERGPIIRKKEVAYVNWIKKGTRLFSRIVRSNAGDIRPLIDGNAHPLILPNTLLVIDECYSGNELITEVLSRGGRVIAAWWNDRRGGQQLWGIPPYLIETFRLKFEDNVHIPMETRERTLGIWEYQSTETRKTRNEGAFTKDELVQRGT